MYTNSGTKQYLCFRTKGKFFGTLPLFFLAIHLVNAQCLVHNAITSREPHSLPTSTPFLVCCLCGCRRLDVLMCCLPLQLFFHEDCRTEEGTAYIRIYKDDRRVVLWGENMYHGRGKDANCESLVSIGTVSHQSQFSIGTVSHPAEKPQLVIPPSNR